MVYYLLLCFAGLKVDLFAAFTVSPSEKDLEIILLRQQRRIVERKLKTQPRLSRPEKLLLVAIVTRFKTQTACWRDRLNETLVLFKPDTLLKWHRELVRQKWTLEHPRRSGRPPVDAELEALIIQLAGENPRMGYEQSTVNYSS